MTPGISRSEARHEPGRPVYIEIYTYGGSGIGRNLAIEVLEFFDKARFTRRSAAGRTVLKPAAEVFGDG